MIDKVKIFASVLILIAGIYFYYELPNIMGPDVSILIRVGVILLAIVIALAVAATSQYGKNLIEFAKGCLLYTSPSPRDRTRSRMPSSA